MIFEEIPPVFFDDYYIDKTRNKLEIDTINRYMQNHTIAHVPVGSDNLPSQEYFKNHRNMIERIEGLADINGFNFRNLIDNNMRYKEVHGFKYLNSKESMEINNQIYSAIEKGLQKINDEKLIQTFKLPKDINHTRETEMLKNIYEYSHIHPYERAIFTIGAAHRKSIMLKIIECQKNEGIKLKWIFL